MNEIRKRIQIFETDNNLSLTIKSFNYSPTRILIHLERLEGLKVISKRSFLLTDEFEAYFTYKTHTFVLFTPFSEIEIEPDTKETPKEVTSEIFEHLYHYKMVWLHNYIYGLIKYALKPSNKR